MIVHISRVELEHEIALRAQSRKVPPELIVHELLAQVLGVALNPEPWRVVDRPAALVMTLIANNAPEGVTLNDVRAATGWQYRKTAAVLKRLIDTGQATRVRRAHNKAKGAPAWRYVKAPTAPAVEAVAELPPIPREKHPLPRGAVPPDKQVAGPTPRQAAYAATRLARDVERVTALLRAAPAGITMAAMMLELGQRSRTIGAALEVLFERKQITFDARVIGPGLPVRFYTLVSEQPVEPAQPAPESAAQPALESAPYTPDLPPLPGTEPAPAAEPTAVDLLGEPGLPPL